MEEEGQAKVRNGTKNHEASVSIRVITQESNPMN